MRYETATLRRAEGFFMTNQHDQLIGFKIYDAQRSIFKSLETALKPYDVTPGQWNLLNQLDRAGELSQKELAERTRKEQATITRYIDTLERKKLVVREQHKTDRRTHVVRLTERAHKLIAATQPVAADAANKLVQGVDQQNLEVFVGVLAQLKGNAEHYAQNSSAV